MKYTNMKDYSRDSEQLGRLIRDKLSNPFSIITRSVEELIAMRTAMQLDNIQLLEEKE